MSFSDAGRRVIEGVSAGLYEAGTIIMAESQVLVPVDTGTLKRSGIVEQPELSDGGDSMTVTVGYAYGAAYEARASGDGDEHVGPGYAYWVEVRDELHHEPPTQSRYLEVPAKAMEPELGHIIEDNVRMRLAGP